MIAKDAKGFIYEVSSLGVTGMRSEIKTCLLYTSPAEALLKFKNVSSHCYMLESCEDRENHGSYTFVGYDPKLEIRDVYKRQAESRS